MRCTMVNVNGVRAIVCGTKKLPVCHVCQAPAGVLCDFKTGRKTCSKQLCRRCAVSVGPDRDYCPDHPGAASQLALGF